MISKGVQHLFLSMFLTLLLTVASSADNEQQINQATAIVGATVIDGNGGPPLTDTTIVIVGKHIEAIGPASTVEVPADAAVIDGVGKFITPGFIDTNVHISLYGGGRGGPGKETAIAYWNRNDELTLEMAQMHLKYGVTTIRDSYGTYPALKKVRDMVTQGEVIGRRLGWPLLHYFLCGS